MAIANPLVSIDLYRLTAGRGTRHCAICCEVVVLSRPLRPRRVRHPTPMGAKRKGRFLLREIAPAFRFFEDLVRHPDHSRLSVRSYSKSASEPAYPVPRPSIRCKSFSRSIRNSQSPECCVSLVSDSLTGPLSDPLAGLVPLLFRVPLPVLFEASSPILFGPFAGPLASSASGSCGVPFPVLLRVPFPALLTVLVDSLLLEDCSSVELKDTPDLQECKGCAGLYFCGNRAFSVDIS